MAAAKSYRQSLDGWANPHQASLARGLDRSEPQPGQLRAAALPTVPMLVRQLYKKLLGKALQKSGAKAVKTYLKNQAKPGQPFSAFMAEQLEYVDRIYIAQTKKAIQLALKDKKYDKARSLLRSLRTEYSESDSIAKYVDTGINKVTLGFKFEAESHFDMTNFKPQTEAYQYFLKMAATAEEPVLKGYAYFRAADAAGTMKEYNKGIAQLRDAIKIWEKMTPEQRPPKPADMSSGRKLIGAKSLYYIEDCEYFLGFYYGAGLKDRDKGIALQRKFADKYPDSMWAPAALFDVVRWYRWSDRDKIAADACRELIKRYPKSTEAANARGLLITDYKKFSG